MVSFYLKRRFSGRLPAVEAILSVKMIWQATSDSICWYRPMGHGPCTFKKRDVKTALQAVRESGVEVARVEIDKTGKIVIIAAGRAIEADSAAEPSEWD